MKLASNSSSGSSAAAQNGGVFGGKENGRLRLLAQARGEGGRGGRSEEQTRAFRGVTV